MKDKQPFNKNTLLIVGVIVVVAIILFFTLRGTDTNESNPSSNDIEQESKKQNQNFDENKVLEMLDGFNISYRFDQTIDKYNKKTQIMILDLRTSPINDLPGYSSDENNKTKLQFIFQSLSLVFLPLYEKDSNSEYYITKWYVSEPSGYSDPEKDVSVIIYTWGSTNINVRNLKDETITAGNFIQNLDQGQIGIDYE